MHSNDFLNRRTLWQCILNHDALSNGLACMVASLLGLSDMVVSIVELSAIDSSS